VRSGDPESDEALVAALRGGDLAAFDVLYQRYAARLFGYLRRMVDDDATAEDLLQDVILSVLQPGGFDATRGRFGAWLFAVARNRCVDLRRAAARGAARAPLLGVTESHAPDERRRHAVRSAIASLPEAQQQLLLLKQVGGLTYREIAEVHGIPEGTVKSRLHAAVEAFRRALAQIGEEPS
jgi:RNA polymerase sigma-70 factor, ECF subfamily